MPSRGRSNPGHGSTPPKYPGTFLLAFREAVAGLGWQVRKWMGHLVECADPEGREHVVGLENLFRRARQHEREMLHRQLTGRRAVVVFRERHGVHVASQRGEARRVHPAFDRDEHGGFFCRDDRDLRPCANRDDRSAARRCPPLCRGRERRLCAGRCPRQAAEPWPRC